MSCDCSHVPLYYPRKIKEKEIKIKKKRKGKLNQRKSK